MLNQLPLYIRHAINQSLLFVFQSPTATDQQYAAYASIVAPTIPVEHMRAAENVGIALANKLKAAGADDIVQAAKDSIKTEILMQAKDKEFAIKQALSSDSSVTTTTTTAAAANVAANGQDDNSSHRSGANNVCSSWSRGE